MVNINELTTELKKYYTIIDDCIWYNDKYCILVLDKLSSTNQYRIFIDSNNNITIQFIDIDTDDVIDCISVKVIDKCTQSVSECISALLYYYMNINKLSIDNI